MINKLRIVLYPTILALALFSVGRFAEAQSAVNFNDDTIITVNGVDYFIDTTSEATSVVVNPTTVVATVPNAETFIFGSDNGYTISSDQATATTACTGGTNKLTYTSSGSTTITITPNSSSVSCSSVGGGGGGSSKKITKVNNNTTIPTVVPQNNSAPKVYNFGTAVLKNGSRGEAAKELQRFLNAKLNLGLVVDGIIGPKSIAVIKKWQKDNGLVADGLIGPKTKAKMNASVSAY